MRAVAFQAGPVTGDLPARLRQVHEMLVRIEPPPDLVVLPELFSRPFWCVGFGDERYFDWAESLEGPTVSKMRDTARQLDAHLVVPFFERGRVEGEYYNSAALIGPDGELIAGTMPTGEAVSTYRKNAVSAYLWDGHRNDEKFYFKTGPGFPVFETRLGMVGILICYDRWFPEAWRVLALQGAKIVCVPNASQGFVSDMLIPSMRTAAAQNQIFVIVANRAGAERLEDVESHYYGLSCIVGPRGDLLAEGGEAVADQVVAADLDLDRIGTDRRRQPMYRDRRAELYEILSREMG